jgi:hypothetical protein
MTDDTHVIPAGRPVRLVPTAPGFWRTVLGVALAGLAPLFGFLIGTILGDTNSDFFLQPIYWGLFVGVLIGGVGVLIAVLGGRRLWLHHRDRRPVVEEEIED